MEKKLIFRDEHQVQKTIEVLNQFVNELTPLKEAFEELNIGQYSNEVFTSQRTANGKNEINTYIENERNSLVKAGITNSVTLDGILKNHEPIVKQYKESLTDVFEKCNLQSIYIDISLFEFTNNKFTLSKTAIDKVNESMSVYANGKEEIEIHEQIEALINNFYLLKTKIENYIGYQLPEHIKIKDFVFNNLVKQYEREDKMIIKNDCFTGVKRLKK